MIKKETEQKIDILLDGYIKTELKRLDNGEIHSINLKNVSLEKLEEYLEYDHDTLDFNGWQGDYWCSNEKYIIDGCMYDASVCITLKE